MQAIQPVSVGLLVREAIRDLAGQDAVLNCGHRRHPYQWATVPITKAGAALDASSGLLEACPWRQSSPSAATQNAVLRCRRSCPSRLPCSGFRTRAIISTRLLALLGPGGIGGSGATTLVRAGWPGGPDRAVIGHFRTLGRTD